MAVTGDSRNLRESIAAHRDELDGVLRRYRARNPRLFGSVARGEATAASDIDILVDLEPDGGNELLRIAGLGEEFSQVLGTRVDVVTPSLLRTRVSETALADAVAL
ncbi:nucleotidyltransferase family protein [Georgenia subflava]|uniref:Nucleotidyltransferase n=1 Tax=Georgenia subflava TaxID=1622177 RepID=A0A6N7ES33_9MICO|nr:nucleotidyltransferase family protein [Georgenia subflava]MPV38926.1 nucleotidyltransferase [Georgenia subflava]